MIGLFDSRPAYLPSVISTRAILKSGPGSGRTGNQINLQVWDIIQAPAGERIFLSCWKIGNQESFEEVNIPARKD